MNKQVNNDRQDIDDRQADRLIEIESKLAYQEDLLQSLNDIIVKQQESIDILEMRLKKLIEQVMNGDEGAQFADNSADELPPHY